MIPLKTGLQKFAEQIINLKWFIIIATIILTTILGFQLQNLSINSDILKSLPEEDKNASLLKEIGRNFGGQNIGLLILETDNVYNTSTIEHIASLTESLGEIEGINSVSSVTNIINIKGDDFGLEVGQLVDPYDIPESDEDFDALRENIQNNKLYKGSIISDDETSALIMFYLDEEAIVKDVATQVIEVSDELNLPENLYYAGSPMLVSYISDLMRKDLTTLLPIAFLVIALTLFFSFRSASGVLLPLISSLVAIIWTLGSIALLGYNMTMISNNIPIILLAVGSAYSIHVVNKINLVKSESRKDKITEGLSSVTIPVILAGVTTAIGFVSFIFGAYLDMVVEFGIFTSLGTLYSCVLALTLVPALMAVAPAKPGSAEGKDGPKFRALDKFSSQLSRLVNEKAKPVFWFWIILILVGVAGIFSIERSVNIQDYFKPGNPARKAEQIMMEKFGGTKPVFMLFEGEILDPLVLNKMKEAAQYMEQSPDINSTLSVADLIAELNYAITGVREIPQDPDQIQQLWFFLEGNETLDRLVSADLTQGIIISKFKSPDNESKKVFAEYMDEFVANNQSDDFSMQITGMPFVDIVMDRSLVNSQIASILIALVFVIIVIGLILRSFKYGILATIPIIAAIIILFGLMGWTGISLNIATVLVASVALGIGIDYSIHIVVNFNKQFQIHQNARQAVSESILSSGKAIIINFIAVSLGFLVLVFSDMIPLIYFGILVAASMISSGLGALTLFPVVLYSVNRKNDEG